MARLVEGGEAAFLSEAARGRSLSPAATKLNGAAAPVEAKLKASAPKIEVAQAARAGAPLGPVEVIPEAPIPVIAAREGTGGGTVSKAVMLPEPERSAAAETAPIPQQVPAHKKKRGFFSWWFHSRIRGGVTH
jgi:hypothetical protein